MTKAIGALPISPNTGASCTAHGLLIDAIDGVHGARRLRAAQIAFTGVRCQPAPRKSAA